MKPILPPRYPGNYRSKDELPTWENYSLKILIDHHAIKNQYDNTHSSIKLNALADKMIDIENVLLKMAKAADLYNDIVTGKLLKR